MQKSTNYESLVESEDMLVNRIETCSETIDAVLQMLFKRTGRFISRPYERSLQRCTRFRSSWNVNCYLFE